MANHRLLFWFLLLAVFVSGVFLSSFSHAQNQDSKSKQRVRDDEVDHSRFPLIDLSTPSLIDPAEWTKRQAKGRRYNNKFAPQIEDLISSLLVDHSLYRFTALPTDQSSAVILGMIKDARAYLSEDRSTVYSEFLVSVQSVFKNDTAHNLSIDEVVEIHRYGGRARLPSGRIALVAVDHHDMPQIGAKYVLFLTDGKQGEAFSILTGYELREGKVYTLDRLRPWHPMAQYTGRDEAILLKDLTETVGNR